MLFSHQSKSLLSPPTSILNKITYQVRITSCKSKFKNIHTHIRDDFRLYSSESSVHIFNFFSQNGFNFVLNKQLLLNEFATFTRTIISKEFFLFIFFQLTYKNNFKLAHKFQFLAWKLLKLGTPFEFDKSILGFSSERAELLAKLMGFNYVVSIASFMLSKLGMRIRADFPSIFSKVSYALYFSHFLDLFKTKFLHLFAPKLAESKRQSYVVNRATSVVIWFVGILISCEMISTYLKIPLTSILAFGGVGELNTAA